MSLGYSTALSSLSTKLFIKSLSLPKEDESKLRIHKVSLVNEAETTDVFQDTVDFKSRAAVSNGPDLIPEYKWKNNFDGVSQYKPPKAEDFSSFDSYRMSDTYSSTSPLPSLSAPAEATACKYLSKSISSTSPSSYSSSCSTLSTLSEEQIAPGNTRSDGTEVYLRHESEPAGDSKDEWRRSLVQQEEPSAPAGEKEGEAERIQSHWDSQQLPVSDFSSLLPTNHADGFEEEDESSRFTGVFKATFVELVADPPAPPCTPPDSPDFDSSIQFDMNNLMDTLKSMGPPQRPRGVSLRAPPQTLVSSLPPIVEDAPILVSSDVTDSHTSPTKAAAATDTPAESPNRLYTLPADLGLKRGSARDSRSPMELMKQSQQVKFPQT